MNTYDDVSYRSGVYVGSAWGGVSSTYQQLDACTREKIWTSRFPGATSLARPHVESNPMDPACIRSQAAMMSKRSTIICMDTIPRIRAQTD